MSLSLVPLSLPLDSLAAATSGARSRQPPAGIDGAQHTNVTHTLRSSLLSGEIRHARPLAAKRGRLPSLGFCSPALIRSPPSPSSAPSLHPSCSRGIPSIHGRQHQIRRPTSWSTDGPPPSSHGVAAGSLARACFHSRRSVELAGPRRPRDLGFAVAGARCLGCVPASHPSDLAALGLDAAGLDLQPGFVVPLDVGRATQLDIEAVFQVQAGAAAAGSVAAGAEAPYNCSASAGAAGRGLLGPFGLLVLGDDGLSEQTAVYFYLVKGADGKLSTHFCQYAFRQMYETA